MTSFQRGRDMGRIKGVAFREFAIWYAENVDSSYLREVAEQLEAQHPDLFDSSRPGYGILATRWYDARIVHGLLDRVVERHTGSDLDELAQSAADQIMARSLTGVYRFVFSTFATPPLYAKHAQKLWSLHYDTGTVTIDTHVPAQATARYEKWNSHHPLICRLNMAASRAIYTALDCADVRWTRLACVSAGDVHCELLIRWRR